MPLLHWKTPQPCISRRRRRWYHHSAVSTNFLKATPALMACHSPPSPVLVTLATMDPTRSLTHPGFSASCRSPLSLSLGDHTGRDCYHGHLVLSYTDLSTHLHSLYCSLGSVYWLSGEAAFVLLLPTPPPTVRNKQHREGLISQHIFPTLNEQRSQSTDLKWKYFSHCQINPLISKMLLIY